MEQIGGGKEYQRIWNDAEKLIRKKGYTITLEKFEDIFGSFCDLAVDFDHHSDRVLLVAHEAVEAEEVKNKTGQWMLPRDYYDKQLEKGIVEIEAHHTAEAIAPIEHRSWQLLRTRELAKRRK
jgi:hypothetical protein